MYRAVAIHYTAPELETWQYLDFPIQWKWIGGGIDSHIPEFTNIDWFMGPTIYEEDSINYLREYFNALIKAGKLYRYKMVRHGGKE